MLYRLQIGNDNDNIRLLISHRPVVQHEDTIAMNELDIARLTNQNRKMAALLLDVGATATLTTDVTPKSSKLTFVEAPKPLVSETRAIMTLCEKERDAATVCSARTPPASYKQSSADAGRCAYVGPAYTSDHGL